MRYTWMGVLLLFCAGAVPRATPAASVAVMPFIVPPDNPALAWARQGIPDLLTAELSARGWEVVDREILERVLHEQELDDNIQAGRLVGADYILTGKVFSSAPSQIQVQAILANVESLDSGRLSVQSGKQPEDTYRIVQKIAEELAPTEEVSLPSTAISPKTWIPRPETIICFHRGLAAFADGYPEIAVPWFIMAYRKEPKFAPARTWEVQAYETMGFDSLAQCAREKHGEKLANPIPADSPTAKSIVLTRPFLAPAEAWNVEQLDEIMRAFAGGLANGEGIRFIDYDAMAHAIREQDVQLGGFFTGDTVARYGQWRIPDGILLCRLESRGSNVLIQLWLYAPETAKVAICEAETVSGAELSGKLSELTTRLMAKWENPSGTMTAGVPPEVRPMVEADLADLSESYRPVVQALHQLRQREGFEEWRALAEAFNSVDCWNLEGTAVDQAIGHIDLDAENAAATLLFARKLFTATVAPYQRPLRAATPELILGMESNLLARFPDSLFATALRYENGWQAWRKQRFAEAERWMSQALAGLQCGRSADEDEAILGAKYILADSMSRDNRPDEALPLFRELNDYMLKHPEAGDSLPSVLSVESNQQMVCRERCELAVRGHVRNAVQGRKSGGSGKSSKPRLPVAEFFNPDGRCEGTLTKDTCLPAMNALVDAWQTSGSFAVCGQSDLNILWQWLYQMAKLIDEEERQKWFPKLVAAYLQRQGVHASLDPDEFAPEIILPQIGDIWKFYCLAGLRQDGLSLIDRFMGPGVAPAIAFRALAQTDTSLDSLDMKAEELELRLNRLAERLPGGERDIPGALWAQLAASQLSAKDWPRATESMKKGFSSSEPATPGDEAARILIRSTLRQRTGDPFVAIRTSCGEMGLLPWVPRWWQWYNEGIWAADEGEHAIAISCFQVLLRYLEDPLEMDSTIAIKNLSNGETFLVQGPDMDFRWFKEQADRRISTQFRLALSLLALKQPDKAATYLREIALEAKRDKVSFLHESHLNFRGSNTVDLRAMASSLLHCLHLLNEVQFGDEPILDRRSVIGRCRISVRELNSLHFQTGAHIIYEMANRLKASPPQRPTYESTDDRTSSGSNNACVDNLPAQTDAKTEK